jgi:uncharacterized 2Fe-2S/4Fe-4S cluster protein (DUF4445 family)
MGMEYTVRIHKKGKITEKKVEDGTNLLTFLRKNTKDMNTPCGGKGTCGKCTVRVDGLVKEPTAREKDLLGKKQLENGYRLACFQKVQSDLQVYFGKEEGEARIVTEAKERNIKLDPIVAKQFFTLGVPDIKDQRSDMQRVLDVLEKSKTVNDIGLMKELPAILRKEGFQATLILSDKKLLTVEPGDTSSSVFGIAVDIGTTTIAAYLLDLVTGKKADVYSLLNPQKKFGADVVSRIEHTMNNSTGLNEVNRSIVSCMNRIIRILTSRNNLTTKDIYAITFVGNTTMMHFLMKLPSANIAAAPFIPVTTQMHKFRAKELGLSIHPQGQAIIFPCVSAYIGADTVGAVLSSGMYREEKVSLLVDIGTNGEIVLGNDKWMYACSTAAGPAFEGANIRNGVGGITGAIDRIQFTPAPAYTTIGNEKAIGICGSGIVDAIAGMLETGIIDETGRIVDSDELDENTVQVLGERLVEIDGKNSFLVAASQECNSGSDIAITQKDVRELQNAKAAIAAGIKILVKTAGISMAEVDRVYLAGGFGSYINIDSAIRIGLIPTELKGRIESIGNAAGAGAVEGLLSLKMLKKADEIKERIEYIELSACHEFMDEYVECMLF